MLLGWITGGMFKTHEAVILHADPKSVKLDWNFCDIQCFEDDQNGHVVCDTMRFFRTIPNIRKKYVVGSKSFRPDQLFKVTEIKQLCYFST